MLFVTQAPHQLHSTPSCSKLWPRLPPPAPPPPFPSQKCYFFSDRQVLWHFQGLGLLSSTRVSSPLILIKERFPSGRAEPRWCSPWRLLGSASLTATPASIHHASQYGCRWGGWRSQMFAGFHSLLKRAHPWMKTDHFCLSDAKSLS